MAKRKTLMQREFEAAVARKRRPGRFPKAKNIKPLERTYQRALRQITGRIRELVAAHLTPALPALTDTFEQNRSGKATMHLDAADDDIRRIISTIRAQLYDDFTPDEIRRIAQRAGTSVSAFNKRVQTEGLKRVAGIDVFFEDAGLANEMSLFAYLNTQLITKMSDNALSEIEGKVFQGWQDGLRWEEISSDLQDRLGVAESRADLIARDQVSKLNGQLTKTRQRELGITSYIWRTSLDDRVRDSHAEKEGQEYDWDSPPMDTGHPGEDIQCRCTAEPVIRYAEDDSEDDDSED